MVQKDERRKSPRFDFAWPIEVATEMERAEGKTENISRSGAFFRSTMPSSLKPGVVVDVRINVSADVRHAGKPETIAGRARVVRLEEFPGGCGIALHFSEEIDALPKTPSKDR